ncbi:unnamed protein product [Cylindrotheca closterium]|uniref:Uncharacterized protein n=1 Tax=Cylindrotheca closterium TaxID=2856 RepID=A0AAD2CL27_9STRA|nr:unnamed protein product [Cylindrotheca closterium]
MFKREMIDTSLLSPPPAPASRTTKPSNDNTATTMCGAWKANASCSCGKVKARIQTLDDDEAPPPMRLVCYCRDCRGYFETLLNQRRMQLSPQLSSCKTCMNVNKTGNGAVGEEEEEVEEEMNEEADERKREQTDAWVIDEWGGVNWTCLYPRDIQMVQGTDLLKVVKIRQGSKIRQVHSTCCHSPIFRIGSVSLLVNSNIIESEQEDTTTIFLLPPIQYRIIGRQAWKKRKVMENKVGGSTIVHQKSNQILVLPKPKMSWSVPFGWYFCMPKRIRSDLMEPMPLEFDEEDQVEVLKDFQEGSK